MWWSRCHSLGKKFFRRLAWNGRGHSMNRLWSARVKSQNEFESQNETCDGSWHAPRSSVLGAATAASSAGPASEEVPSSGGSGRGDVPARRAPGTRPLRSRQMARGRYDRGNRSVDCCCFCTSHNESQFCEYSVLSQSDICIHHQPHSSLADVTRQSTAHFAKLSRHPASIRLHS